eukprot:COSAG06_NODE_66267_length_254_cov_2.548387_1_plen_58_part_01
MLSLTGLAWYTKMFIPQVAHGDILQILQTAFEQDPDIPPSLHRTLPHLENAAPRLLNH